MVARPRTYSRCPLAFVTAESLILHYQQLTACLENATIPRPRYVRLRGYRIQFPEDSMKIRLRQCTPAVLAFLLLGSSASAQDQPAKLTANWDKVLRTSQTTPTLQVVVNPPLQRGTPVHNNAFQSLHDLAADYVRYVPSPPYP